MKKYFLLIFIVLGFAGCLATAKSSWRKANESNTIIAYSDFVNKYPKSEFSSEAKNRIVELERQKEEHDWENAEGENIISSYAYFLRNYPNSKYSQLAQDKIGKLKAEREKLEERKKERLRAFERSKRPLTDQEFKHFAQKIQSILEPFKLKGSDIVIPPVSGTSSSFSRSYGGETTTTTKTVSEQNGISYSYSSYGRDVGSTITESRTKQNGDTVIVSIRKNSWEKNNKKISVAIKEGSASVDDIPYGGNTVLKLSDPAGKYQAQPIGFQKVRIYEGKIEKVYSFESGKWIVGIYPSE